MFLDLSKRDLSHWKCHIYQHHAYEGASGFIRNDGLKLEPVFTGKGSERKATAFRIVPELRGDEVIW